VALEPKKGKGKCHTEGHGPVADLLDVQPHGVWAYEGGEPELRSLMRQARKGEVRLKILHPEREVSEGQIRVKPK